MLAEEKGSVIVIDNVGGNLRDKIARRSLSKSLARVAQNWVHRIAGERGFKIAYPESSLRFAQSMMQFLVFFLGGGSRAATIAYAF